MSLSQNLQKYSNEDHRTWSYLYERQSQNIKNYAAKPFVKGFELLSLDPGRIPELEELNSKLKHLSDWQVLPVKGLVPNVDFFTMLSNRCFPLNLSIRTPDEIDFSKLPDLFHDLCGHIPMLVENAEFDKFLMDYSIVALKYITNEKVMEWLARYYWFVLEVGLVQEQTSIKPFGGAILTSGQELQNVVRQDVIKHPFDFHKVINTRYDNYTLQKDYFYIESFDQLYDSLIEMDSFFKTA